MLTRHTRRAEPFIEMSIVVVFNVIWRPWLKSRYADVTMGNAVIKL